MAVEDEGPGTGQGDDGAGAGPADGGAGAGDQHGDGGQGAAAGGDEGGADDGDAGKPAPKPGPDPETEAALRRANYEAQQRRKDLTRLQKELDDLRAANATEAEKALILARQEAAREAEAKWRPQIVQLRADAALQKSNVTDPGDRELLLGRIKAGDVELDDDGNVLGGLDDQIAALKDRYPKMFEAPAAARRPTARDVDAGNKPPAPPAPKTVAEQLAARLGIPAQAQQK